MHDHYMIVTRVSTSNDACGAFRCRCRDANSSKCKYRCVGSCRMQQHDKPPFRRSSLLLSLGVCGRSREKPGDSDKALLLDRSHHTHQSHPREDTHTHTRARGETYTHTCMMVGWKQSLESLQRAAVYRNIMTLFDQKSWYIYNLDFSFQAKKKRKAADLQIFTCIVTYLIRDYYHV